MPNRLAWLTPDTLPAEMFCRQLSIPNDPLILAAVSGALYPLTKAYNWEEYGSVTPDEIASAMLDMLDAYIAQTTGDCEGSGMTCADVLACLGAAGVSLYEYPFVRKSPTTGLPEWSIDESTWWEIETVTSTPVASTCLAATRAAMVMDRFWQQTFVAVGELFFSALATANQFLQWVNQGLLGIIYGSNAQLANAIIFTDFDFDTYMVQSELTATQLKDLTCLLLDNATLQDDDTVTFDFEAISDNLISELGVNPGTALTLLLAYMGGDGLNQAGQVQITDIYDCSPCATDYDWCHTFDFTAGQQGFVDFNSPTAGSATYVAGVGWKAKSGTWNCGAGSVTYPYRNATVVFSPTTSFYCVRVVIEADGTCNTGFNLVAPGGSHYETSPGNEPGTPLKVLEVDQTVAYLAPQIDRPNPGELDAAMTRVTVYGTGTDPWSGNYPCP